MKSCGVTDKFYVEVDEDTEIFVKMIIEIIKILRKNLEYVVASCGFEDKIVEEKGWNWTEETPFS